MSAPLYGIGYEPLGDLADFIDPFGLRKIPAKVDAKINKYVDEKATRAAGIAQKRVEAGVKNAMNDTARGVGTFIAGGLLVGAVAGGVYVYRRNAAKKEGHR